MLLADIGWITTFDMLFLVMGFIHLVDKMKVMYQMPLLSHHDELFFLFVDSGLSPLQAPATWDQ